MVIYKTDLPQAWRWLEEKFEVAPKRYEDENFGLYFSFLTTERLLKPWSLFYWHYCLLYIDSLPFCEFDLLELDVSKILDLIAAEC